MDTHIQPFSDRLLGLDRTPFGDIASNMTPKSVVLAREGGGWPTRDVFSAIADPTRRQLLHLLAEVDELPLHEMTARFRMGRTGVSKHLAILKEAGLVERRKVGRETRYHLNAAPLREIQEWVSFYEEFWTQRVDRLKDLLEEENG